MLAKKKLQTTPAEPVDPRIGVLLDALDQAFDKKAWHGTNLKGALRGVRVGVASWRLADDRHTIWELVLHAAYWKYLVTRRLVGGPRGAFARKGSNWFERPADDARDEAAWREDLALLRQAHAELRAAVAVYDPAKLDLVPRGSDMPAASMILGVALHDTYHGGQIQLLKRLHAER